MDSNRTLIIDGDIIAYQVSFAKETSIHWGDGLWTMHATEGAVSAGITEAINDLKEKAQTPAAVVALSDSDNFRYDIAPYYKANRKDTRKPMMLNFAKQFIKDNFTALILPTLEADDVLGIMTSGFPGSYVCWSQDKDLRSVPGFHLIDDEIKEITEAEADLCFYTQTLTGDPVGNYKGCPRIGPIAAAKLLSGSVDYWDTVVSAYRKAGLSELVALENARLARILRHSDYDFEEKRVRLWCP